MAFAKITNKILRLSGIVIYYYTINCSKRVKSNINLIKLINAMYIIKKLTVASSGTIVNETTIEVIDCNENEFINELSSKYKALVKLFNLNYSIHGSNLKVKFIATPIKARGKAEAIKAIDYAINKNVDNINSYIDTINKATRSSNKKNNKRKDDNCVKHIKAIDYLLGVKCDGVIEDKDKGFMID